jgi:hypothetical protein
MSASFHAARDGRDNPPRPGARVRAGFLRFGIEPGGEALLLAEEGPRLGLCLSLVQHHSPIGLDHVVRSAFQRGDLVGLLPHVSAHHHAEPRAPLR